MTESTAPAIDPAAPADLIEVGRVVEAYGVRGGLKVQPFSGQPDALLAARKWWLSKGAEVRSVRVESAKRHGAAIAASWAGVADRDQAQAWKGWSVLVPRSQFPAPAEGEFYWVDLIGCELLGIAANGTDKVILGTVADVSDNGAHAILRVSRVVPVAPGEPTQPLLDAKGREQEVLVPFVDAYIRNVDLGAKFIDSDWPADF